jgi:eukaryotic-like serine/threonine-protein kinase
VGLCRTISVEPARRSVNALPRQFDGYRLERLLGRGGMGEVHVAHDTLLDRKVAIKVIATEALDDESRRRFMVEARAVARLDHPNVVSVYRVGEVGGYPYLVSELVRGRPLDALEESVDGPTALKIAMDLASGLATAHRRGVLHRDIKPGNAILSDDGTVKLLDFGVAKLLGERDPEAGSWTTGVTAPGDMPTRRVPSSLASKVDTLEVAPRNLGTSLGEALTDTGVALGTPQYMAPEIWLGRPSSFRSDIYSLGALLFALCAERAVHTETNIEALCRAVTSREATPLFELRPDLDPRFCTIVDRCLCRDPVERYATASELRGELTKLLPGARRQRLPKGNPYRGLSPFEAEHQAVYFGRDSETRLVLDKLVSEPFVLIVGDSGVGKSSLCRAGVVPRVDEWLGGSRSWQVLTVVPGRRPAAALAATLAPLLEESEDAIARRVIEDPSSVARDLRAWAGAERGLLLHVDQLEELVTIAELQEAEAVAQCIGWLALPSPGARLLASVRGDFLSRLALLPRLGDLITRAMFFLRPLSRERIREAIERPAEAMGVGFESEELVQSLVETTIVAGDGGLPLLQYKLAELWEARPNHTMICEASLEAVGGVGGALARHADHVLAPFTPQERRIARRVLCALVTAEGVRIHRSDRELRHGDDAVARVVTALVRGRLLIARDSSEGTSFEIAHEALIEHWDTLRSWLGQDAEGRRMRERLQAAVTEWHRLDEGADLLWSPRQLGELERHPVSLAPPELSFVETSRRHHRRRHLTRMAAVTMVPLLVVLTAAAFGYRDAPPRPIAVDACGVRE